ncbi:MAG TPA: sigma-E factor regulatory protein RseB domain-containing protein [Candidatus Nitrosotalea sp.]|nr:sigma-E factor regulatory protein RseB domain-containing protein [Candidatus Nitrosotalea sp.]
MKRTKFIAVAFAAATISIAGAQPANDGASAMLMSAITATSVLSYTGTVEVFRGGKSSETTVFHVEHRAPDLTRRSYTEPANLSGDAVLVERGLIYSVDSERHRVVERRSDPAEDTTALDADYALLRENYRVVLEGDESVAGRRTLGIGLINKYTDRSTMLVRVDAVTKLVLEKDEFAADGARVDRMRFVEVRYAAAPASDFSLPSGFPVVRGDSLEGAPESPSRAVESAGFAVREPHSLPGGFAPVEGDVVELRGVRTVHLLYSDGIRNVSLFENAAPSTLQTSGLTPERVHVDGREAEYAQQQTTALLSWEDGPLHYTLVGEAGLVDLQRIASSIDK